MKLEFANGKVMEVTDSGDLEKELETLGGNNDFATLTDGDSFIQTSSGGSGYLFQYSEAGIMYESSTADAGLEKVKSIFRKYLTGDSSWRDGLQWKKMAESGGRKGISDFGNSFSGGRTATGSLKDELINTVKRSVVNWIKRKIR